MQHPVRQALNRWKADNPGKTDRDFAEHLGYHVDALYKHMRGEYIPQQARLRRMAAVLGWSEGRFYGACVAQLRRSA